MGFKLKTRTIFPALVSVLSPLVLVKNGLSYVFSLDANALFTTPTLTTPNIVGVVDGGNATAGSVGEYIESNIASGSAIAAGATNVAKNLTSISLTAGDWDVSGVVEWIPLATTVLSSYSASISTTTGALDITKGRWTVMTLQTGITGAGNTDGSSLITSCRFSLATTTTIYLVGRATYTTAGLNMYGILRARRVR